VYFFIPLISPADFRLPKRSQERFGLENKVVSAKISVEIREDNSPKGLDCRESTNLELTQIHLHSKKPAEGKNEVSA